MSDAVKFDGFTDYFKAPAGMEEMIGGLYVFRNGRAVVSAWRPTPSELERLNAGELLYVSVLSHGHVLPTFVGCEKECKEVVSDVGKVW